MILRNIGKETCKERTQKARQHIDNSTLLANLHNAHPKGEHSRQSQRNLKSLLRRFKSRVHDIGKYFHIAEENKSHNGNHKSNEKKCDPDII